ncbi:MAG: nucleotide exchange factor GrpE [Candidatus Micrarchaeota archaeon]|nr:nucleotide exchange factor GrpE [Candidatus Micrarchaeota archaeon]
MKENKLSATSGHPDEEKANQSQLPKEQQNQQQEADNQQASISELSSKISQLSEQLLRLHAEFDNYKKRSAKEKEALLNHAESNMMLRFLPIYEEISFAEQEASKLSQDSLKTGILLVLSKLRSAFEKEGLEQLKVEGQKFDPFLHEAAGYEPSDLPEGTVVRVIQNGYKFRGEILRPAVVIVSSGKKKNEN